VFWVALNGAEGGEFAIAGYGFGPDGPLDSVPLRMDVLVDAAIADLSAAA
jgi:hypothetical protein